MVLLALNGCSKKMDGQVFMLKGNGNAEKIALVNIYVVPTDLTSDLNSRISKSMDGLIHDYGVIVKSIPLTEVSKIESTIQTARNDAAAVLNKYSNDNAACQQRADAAPVANYAKSSILFHCVEVIKRGGEALKKANINQENVTQKANKEMGDKTSQLLKINTMTTGPAKLVADQLMTILSEHKIQSTKTNSEGKFSVEVPSGDYTIFAIPQVEQLNMDRLWIVKIDRDANQILLSSDNLFSSSCQSCFAFEYGERWNKSIAPIVDAAACHPQSNTSYQRSCQDKAFIEHLRAIPPL